MTSTDVTALKIHKAMAPSPVEALLRTFSTEWYDVTYILLPFTKYLFEEICFSKRDQHRDYFNILVIYDHTESIYSPVFYLIDICALIFIELRLSIF